MERLHQSGTLTFFLKSFVSLFVIVNALGNAPIWATMLQRFDEDERRLSSGKRCSSASPPSS